MDGIACLGRTRQIGLPCAAPYGSDQGTMIPCSRRHKLMNSNGDGGPARTRTWDQGVMHLYGAVLTL